MANALKEKYEKELRSRLMEEGGYRNPFEVPRVEKVVLNMGLGQATQNSKIIDSAIDEMGAIAGQKPVVTRARKAISNFKLRQGMPIGARVTLRRDRMWEFLERLIHVALPRVRDFKGLSPKSFDGHGNYSIGVREHTIFPEIDLDKVEAVKGLSITICTTAETDQAGRALLRGLGVPMRPDAN